MTSVAGVPSPDTYTATAETVIVCDATNDNVTINLPAASTVTNRIYQIKKIAPASKTATCTVDGNAAETIDGATTQVIKRRYDSIDIVSDGSNWHIL